MAVSEVRCAQQNDAEELGRLVAGFRDHLDARTPTDRDIDRYLPRALSDPAIEFAWVKLNGEAVGYTQTLFVTSVWSAGVEARLEDLFVVAHARGHAIGRALLRYALDRAVGRGATQFSLSTNEGNESAHSLYLSEGITPVSHALYPGGREILWGKSLRAV